MKAMAAHARQFGAEIVQEQVVDVALDGDTKVVTTKKGNRYEAKAVILSPGSEPRLLRIPGETELRGSGVSYCATCDADLYEPQDGRLFRNHGRRRLYLHRGLPRQTL
jgi:thioredoxin reductase (NADPH)